MDELKITSRLMRGLVSKMISRAVYNKLGYKIDIRLNELHVEIIEGTARIHIDADGGMSNKEFMKLVKNVEEED